jgi:ABC-type nitrate/sulfonate/bicarbonate transport system ATPase subunit
MSKVIKISKLQFGFERPRAVLSIAALQIQFGTRVAILGPSGCGKTTLLRLLGGLSIAGGWQEGDLQIDGREPREYREVFGGIAIMFQQPVLLPNRDIAWNVSLPIRIARHSKGEDWCEGANRVVNDALRAVGLEAYAGSSPSVLSGGMRARVALAQAFVAAPQIVLLDEPFGSLDVGWRADLHQKLIERVGELGSTCILVTHDPAEALQVAERVIVLNADGSIMFEAASCRTSRLQLEKMLIDDHSRLVAGGSKSDA